MFLVSRQHLEGRQATLDAAGSTGRWHRSMVYANQRLDRWLGRAIWSYEGFNKLLLFAVLYPMLILLLVWWWTGVGRLGTTVVLPTLGSGGCFGVH